MTCYRFQVEKYKHTYIFDYDDVKQLINVLVDMGDDNRYNIDLQDVFVFTRQLAKVHLE